MIPEILLLDFDKRALLSLARDLESKSFSNSKMISLQTEFEKYIFTQKPDLIISETTNENVDFTDILSNAPPNDIPILFLTNKTDSVVVKKALATRPIMYLTKPYNLEELVINIQLALMNSKQAILKKNTKSDSIFIFDNNVYQRIQKSEILYVEADGAYVKIITLNKKYHLTANLKTFISQFNHPDFFRVSRKHFVNMPHVIKIEKDILSLRLSTNREMRIPMGKVQRQEIMQRFDFLKTKA